MSEASEATQFKFGNSAWKARSSHGRKPIFESPEVLETACDEYFEWIEKNPEYIVEAVKFQGTATNHSVPKRRNMSEGGLQIFLDITKQTWLNYKENPDFFDVTSKVVQIINNHKMDGAITGEFNANIVARELGLAEKQDITVNELEVAGDLLYKKKDASQ